MQDESRALVSLERARLRVLHVSQPAEAGVARCVLSLIADQLARGWEVSLAAPAWGTLTAEAESLGADCHVWVAARSPGPATISEARSLGAIVRKVEPDLVHLHSSKAGLGGRLWIRGRLPTVFQPHAWSFEATGRALGAAARAWERLASRWADAIVCVSEAEAARGASLGIQHERYRVIPNGIALEDWNVGQRADARRELGLRDGPLALCVGRLSRQKGQDLLLAAWPAVRAGVPGAQLVLVGSGLEEERIRALADEDVRVVGARDDLVDWYGAADVVVLPSRWEGMSLVPLEAMACGRSVVATDVDGVREAIGNEAGAVVPAGDTGALATAVAERLGDSELADAEGRAGRRRVESSFGIQETAAAFAALYEELVALREPASSSTAPTIP
ncbi:MAG: glycosyltransferase [Actinomycetota bacterium]